MIKRNLTTPPANRVRVKPELDRVAQTAHTTDSEHAIQQQLVEAVASGDTGRIIASAKRMADFHLAVGMETPTQLQSVEEIALKFNLCTRSIWRLVAKGELPQPIHVGSARRWYASDIEKYLKRQTEKRDGIQRRRHG